MCSECPHTGLLNNGPVGDVQFEGIHPCHLAPAQQCVGALRHKALADRFGTNGDTIILHMNKVRVENLEEWEAARCKSST